MTFTGNDNTHMFGVTTGKVKQVGGEKGKGDAYNRIQVELCGPEITLDNVPIITNSAGENFGTVIIPNVGDTVIVTFIDGNLESPLIIGCIPDKNNPPPLKVDKNNDIKLHKTKSGMQIKIEESNKNSSLTISGKEDSNKKSNSVVFDDKQGLFKISSKDGKCFIKIDLNKGSISVKAKNINFDAENQIKLSATQGGCTISSGEAMNISGNSVKVSSKSTASVEATGQLKLNGNATNVKANGILNLNGGLVKIG